jgi:hypothetical protein
VTAVRIVMDERCFEDTLFRVERTATHMYIADVWMWNGVPIFSTTTFEERQALLTKIYSLYTPCPAFETYSVKLRDALTEIRGTEYYTAEKGARGIYVEEPIFEIVKTDIPDVYKMSNGDYLRVKTLALSKKLKLLGAKFSLPCTNNGDGTWSPFILA